MKSVNELLSEIETLKAMVYMHTEREAELVEQEIAQADSIEELEGHYAYSVKAHAKLLESTEGLIDIVKAVAHIGVDFGYGPFELADWHISKAKELYGAYSASTGLIMEKEVL